MKRTFIQSVGRYFLNVALGLDQLGNTILAGCVDETVSSRLGRIKTANGGKIPWSRPWARMLDAGLDIIDRDHSRKSIEKDEFAQIRAESVWDGDIGTEEKKLNEKAAKNGTGL